MLPVTHAGIAMSFHWIFAFVLTLTGDYHLFKIEAEEKPQLIVFIVCGVVLFIVSKSDIGVDGIYFYFA